jgi:hypothetical protein
MLSKMRWSNKKFVYTPGGFIRKNSVSGGAFNNPAGPNEEMREPDIMIMQNKKWKREFAAEVRRYNKQQNEKIINEQFGRHKAWFYLDM